MKANFATAAIAATYLAISAQGQNFLRYLQQNETCEPEAEASFKCFDAEIISGTTSETQKLFVKGLDEKALCTDHDKTIQIGLDNRAWVRTEKKEGAAMSDII